MSQFPTLKILAFAAHPDDVELAASGTLMKHINMGHACGSAVHKPYRQQQMQALTKLVRQYSVRLLCSVDRQRLLVRTV